MADNNGNKPSGATDNSPFAKPAMEKLEKGLDPYGNRDAPKTSGTK